MAKKETYEFPAKVDARWRIQIPKALQGVIEKGREKSFIVTVREADRPT